MLDDKNYIPIVTNDILIKTNGRLINIPAGEIQLLEAYSNYIKVFTTIQTYPFLVRNGIDEAELKLPAKYFCRVHRSYIVGLRHVKQIYDYTIRIGSKEIPLAKTYSAIFLSRFFLLE